MTTTIPRGIRNNNPLNLRISGNNWRGKKKPNLDGTFEQFESMSYGIRAAIVCVRTYIKNHHLETPAQIITRWAPATENATEKYIAFVCEKSGLIRNQRLTYNSQFAICRLLWAMAIYENGREVEFELFISAWNLI